MYLQVAEPILPYALAFAAGAMVFVVMDDIVPEANSWYVRSVLASAHQYPSVLQLAVLVQSGASAVLFCCLSAVAMAGWPPLEVSLDLL